MSNTPETLTSENFDRIWLEPREGADPYIGRQWCQDNQWGDDGIEYVRADLAALHSAADTPAQGGRLWVNPLEWDEYVTALTPLGTRYAVYREYGRDRECWAVNVLDGAFDTPELAKAAAQADFEQRILSAISSPEPSNRVRHKKRGSEYEVIGVGKMQAEDWISRTVPHADVDMREAVIYRSVDDGSLWVRPREEFEDGRFEPLPPSKVREE